jgi:hypothetical protein
MHDSQMKDKEKMVAHISVGIQGLLLFLERNLSALFSWR